MSDLTEKQKVIAQGSSAPASPSLNDYWDDPNDTAIIVTIDNTISSVSPNPVKNSAIYNALSSKITYPEGGVVGNVLTKTTTGVAWVAGGSGGGSNVNNIKDGAGTNSIVENNIADISAAYGMNTHVRGNSTTKVTDNIADLSGATDAQIIATWTSAGDSKFSLARGSNATVEGSNCLALGANSHAEGNGTLAGNSAAHSEGTGTQATGKYSHAGGLETVASNKHSFAHGNGVKSTGNAAVAFG